MLSKIFYFKFPLKKIVKFSLNFIYNKILRFNKIKWDLVKFNLKKQLKLTKFHKYKLLDHQKVQVNFFGNKHNSYKNKFKELLFFYKKFNFFYFNKNLKKSIENKFIIKIFENNLDYILFCSKFCFSIKIARNYISSNYVYVNNNKINSKFLKLKAGDFIKFKLKPVSKFQKILVNSIKWPIPTKTLLINYKIKEIIFLNNLKTNNLKTFFPIHLKSLN